MNKILIVGATSAIAEACARRWAERGDRLYLAGRNAAALRAIVDDLNVRGAVFVGHKLFDANSIEAHPALVADATDSLGGLDMVLIAHGTLSDQVCAQERVDYALSEIATNGTSVVALMTLTGEQFAKQGHGCIGVISSVAGDRGRQSNYVYGSAKALVSAFASGLRQRLHKEGVAVVTIKPGFVSTPMTAHLKQNGPLWAEPQRVARDIVRAMDSGQPVLYTPWFWRLMMGVIQAIPERLFRGLKL